MRVAAALDGNNYLQLVPVEKELRHEWWSSVLRTSIATQIRAMRENRGWTQAELAKRMGTSQAVVSHAGETIPSAPADHRHTPARR